jgi:hypothetical protein
MFHILIRARIRRGLIQPDELLYDIHQDKQRQRNIKWYFLHIRLLENPSSCYNNILASQNRI